MYKIQINIGLEYYWPCMITLHYILPILTSNSNITSVTRPANMNNSSNSSLLQSNIVTVSLASVSTIACIIAMGALLYYKLWHKFIYRLVLYKLLSLTGSSLSTTIAISLLIIKKTREDVNIYSVFEAFRSLSFGSLAIAIMIAVCIPICIYLMALHNYQFTYKADLCLLIPSILPLLLWAIMMVLLYACVNCGQLNIFLTVTEGSVLVTLFLVNIVFTLLTIVPLSCRACGYNMCMKTTATKESHRKALMEVLPLFILTILPVFSYSFVIILAKILNNSNDRVFLFFVLQNVLYGIPGLFSALSVAFHLFKIRNRLKIKRKKAICYGTVNQQRCTYGTAVYTSEGISETCNTEYTPVSENEEDTRFLLQKNINQMQ